MAYIGDYKEDYATLNFKFTSRTTTGVPTALSGGAVKVYKANATDSESTAGVTLTADFDGVTGLNNVLIDLSADAFYAAGQDYAVVITAGTVGGASVVGEVVALFSIENRATQQSIDQILAVVAGNMTYNTTTGVVSFKDASDGVTQRATYTVSSTSVGRTAASVS